MQRWINEKCGEKELEEKCFGKNTGKGEIKFKRRSLSIWSVSYVLFEVL